MGELYSIPLLFEGEEKEEEKKEEKEEKKEEEKKEGIKKGKLCSSHA